MNLKWNSDLNISIAKRAEMLATNLATEKWLKPDNVGTPQSYIDNAALGHIGTPLGDNYVRLYGYDPYILIAIEAPIINVTRKKTIIKSVVNGLDTSIFQITANGDYNITMNFVLLTDRTWERKRDDFTDFMEILNRKDELFLENAFLNKDFTINEATASDEVKDEKFISRVILDSYTVKPSVEHSNRIDVSLNMSAVADYKMFDKYLVNGNITYKNF